MANKETSPQILGNFLKIFGVCLNCPICKAASMSDGLTLWYIGQQLALSKQNSQPINIYITVGGMGYSISVYFEILELSLKFYITIW